MEKLCVYFILVILANQALGQTRPAVPAAAATPGATPAVTSTTVDPIMECVRTCPVTPEYNPVCGSDNRVYTNPGRLICAQDCGSKVRHVGPAPCPAA